MFMANKKISKFVSSLAASSILPAIGSVNISAMEDGEFDKANEIFDKYSKIKS